jgi:hypothetical protein
MCQGWSHNNVLIIQADLFNPYGEIPQTMQQANERVKDIQYASTQRLSWHRIREHEELRARCNACSRRSAKSMGTMKTC